MGGPQISDRQRKLSARFLWLLPVLTMFWANLHSGYLLGVVLLGTYTVGWVLERWWGPQDESTLTWQDAQRLTIVTGVSFVAAVLNPSGVELWIYPFLTLGSTAMQVYIQEWHSPDFHQVIFWPFAALLVIGILSMVFSRKRPSVTDLLLFLGTGCAGLLSARHIPLFALVSVPIVSRHLLSSLQATPLAPIFAEPEGVPFSKLIFNVANWGILVVAVFVALVWTANTIVENEGVIAERFPVTAVNYLEESGLANEPGYNSYNWGGYLIWRGIPVFVDGRADVYGDAFLFYYLQAFEIRQNWEEPLTDFDVRYVLMEKGSPLFALLEASGDWQEAYRDDIAQIYVRQSP